MLRKPTNHRPSKPIRYLFCAALLLPALLVAGCKPKPEEEPNQLVKTSSFEGVIFSKTNAQQVGVILGSQVEGYWKPSRGDVTALEQGLPAYLKTINVPLFSQEPPIWERLSEYKGQYFGILENGKRVVYANYFCSAPLDSWMEEVLLVLDGGDCYFQIKFEVDTNRFYDLQVNGEA